ncbi:MAG: hypothetical protein HN348_02645 [Proteobacteria bacterium]|nr:hypothetical protein [Pseudomonadota bacterium]
MELSRNVTITELRRAVQWAVDDGAEVVLSKYECAFSEAQESVALEGVPQAICDWFLPKKPV